MLKEGSLWGFRWVRRAQLLGVLPGALLACAAPTRPAAQPLTPVASAEPAAKAEAPDLALVHGDRFRAALQARNGDIGAAVDAWRAAQDKARTILRTEPLDLPALKQAMAESQAKHQAVDTAIHDLIAGVAGQLSAEGRAKLADWPRRR